MRRGGGGRGSGAGESPRRSLARGMLHGVGGEYRRSAAPTPCSLPGMLGGAERRRRAFPAKGKQQAAASYAGRLLLSAPERNASARGLKAAR